MCLMTGLSLERIRQAALNTAKSNETKSRIENMMFAPEYAEPGYSLANKEKGILFSNWNNVDRYDEASKSRVTVDTVMERLSAILEKAGYECEWEDEWTTCCDCGKAVRTQPDCYWWTPAYKFEGDCEILCTDCYKAAHATDDTESSE